MASLVYTVCPAALVNCDRERLVRKSCMRLGHGVIPFKTPACPTPGYSRINSMPVLPWGHGTKGGMLALRAQMHINAQPCHRKASNIDSSVNLLAMRGHNSRLSSLKGVQPERRH